MRVSSSLKYLALFCFGLAASAQNRLTNREIYAFDSGDVFHLNFGYYEATQGSYPVSYLKRTILSKPILSSGLDSIHYLVVDTTLDYIIMHQEYEFKTEKHTISFTNLDSIPNSSDYWIDYYKFESPDSSITGPCNDSGSYQTFDTYTNDTLTEDLDRLQLWCYKGLGCFYYSEQGGDCTYSYYYSQIEFYKKGSKECGKRSTIGLESIRKKDNRIFIYPNPVVDVIHLMNASGDFELFSVFGELVLKGEVKAEINISSIPSGIWFLKIKSDESSQTLKFVKN